MPRNEGFVPPGPQPPKRKSCMKVLATGASGRLGSFVFQELLWNGVTAVIGGGVRSVRAAARAATGHDAGKATGRAPSGLRLASPCCRRPGNATRTGCAASVAVHWARHQRQCCGHCRSRLALPLSRPCSGMSALIRLSHLPGRDLSPADHHSPAGCSSLPNRLHRTQGHGPPPKLRRPNTTAGNVD